jgi:predicted AlkP superfamily phosphohydrolase/phosphomutase
VDKKKLLVINLDGLSIHQLAQLEQMLPVLGSFSKKHLLTSQTGHPLTNPQAMWAEIFTGRSWFDSGCPGYTKPVNNLNNAKIVTESDWLSPTDLIGGSTESPAIIINMPLLLPDDRFRIWLADGSLPLMNSVSPAKIAEVNPFNTYRARAFTFAAEGLSNLSKSVASCLQIEDERLRCAVQLLKQQDWHTCYWRVSIFDTLQHLLGCDLLELSNLSFGRQIEEFLVRLNSALCQMCNLADNPVLISTFHLSPCHARFNLNDLLSLGGFCRFAGNSTNAAIAQRKEAAKTIAASRQEISKHAKAVVATSNYLDLSKTQASSPSSGLIYLNRSRYFKDGIVGEAEAADLMDAITSYLSNYLQDQFAGQDNWSIVTIDKGQLESNRNEATPDLLVQIDGVDFHNTQGQGVIDYINHPRSLHAPGGFFCFPDSMMPKQISTKQAHTILQELLK